MNDHFADPVSPSFRLYARPSFAEGVARLLDVSNALNIYNASSSNEEAVARAFRADLEAIGRDFGHALRQVDEQVHGHKE